jgi:hypothetical protein
VVYIHSFSSFLVNYVSSFQEAVLHLFRKTPSSPLKAKQRKEKDKSSPLSAPIINTHANGLTFVIPTGYKKERVEICFTNVAIRSLFEKEGMQYNHLTFIYTPSYQV